MKTDSELANFLASGHQLAEGSVVWGDDIQLKLTYCLSNKQPPLKYVSSVRAIVFRGDSVLVIRDKNHELYILPGGRRRKTEALEETLRREVLEETGWALKDLSVLGFMHFHHLNPRPADYKYPYPDFIWPVYTAEADTHNPKAIEDDDYVLDSRFYSIDEALKLEIIKGELELLKVAIKLRQDSQW